MKLIIPISKTFWISSLLLLIICPVMGQIKKLKNLTPQEYKLWSSLQETKISANADWISFNLSYESSQDTLILKNIKNQKKYSFPKGSNGTFLSDNYFGCILPDSRFKIFNLNAGTYHDFSNIATYSPVYNRILLQGNISDNKYVLRICTYNGKIIRTLNNVTNHKISPDGTKLAYAESDSKKEISILDFKNNILTTINTSTGISFPNIKWHFKSSSLVFTGYSDNEKKYTALYFYNLIQKKLSEFRAADLDKQCEGAYLNLRYDNSFAISDNQENIFFTIDKNDKLNNEKKDGVQIWNTKDKDLYPLRILLGSSKTASRLLMWHIQTNMLQSIGDDVHSQTLVNLNQQYILLYNEDENKPSFKQNPDINYWLYNTKTGKKSKFLQQQSVNANTVSFSPDGKYFLYFKDQHWWLFSFENQKYICLTANISSSFTDNQNQIPETPYPFGFAGWSKDDKSVFIYDQFDIWEFETKSADGKRLTFGRKNQDIHRFNILKSGFNGNFITKEQVLIPGENSMIRVSKRDNSSSGYLFLDSDRRLKKIVYDKKYVHGIIKAENKKNFLYIKEDFNSPPEIVVNEKIVFQSNAHHKKYFWGTSKLVSYKNSKGISLYGVLIYPADYDPKKKYPMIVNIYQKQTYLLHHYINPSFLNGSTLNVSNYSCNGYFVLLPDIDYKIGSPGFSAVDCVTSAVHEIISSHPVDEKTIGIIGHSFGGYESAFIITQTNIFAAAVAGAAVTNFNSHYLSYNKTIYKPEAWRYEYYQMRMGSDLFSDYSNYQNNSPVTNASKITTPLLSFSGNSDMQVDPVQSKEFYLALRRLQKEHIMLLYPNDNHVLSKPENQKDLTEKTLEWFDFYLKGSSKPQWMESM